MTKSIEDICDFNGSVATSRPQSILPSLTKDTPELIVVPL